MTNAHSKGYSMAFVVKKCDVTMNE